MFRVRWAVAFLAGGLGLISGCSTLREHPWFSRSRPVPTEGCCNPVSTPVVADGPILEGGPPVVPPPGGPLPPGVEPVPLNGQPPGTNGLQRVIPQPQAQPVPAQPSRRTPGLFIDRYKE
jgi:hypothetical protein